MRSMGTNVARTIEWFRGDLVVELPIRLVAPRHRPVDAEEVHAEPAELLELPHGPPERSVLTAVVKWPTSCQNQNRMSRRGST